MLERDEPVVDEAREGRWRGVESEIGRVAGALLEAAGGPELLSEYGAASIYRALVASALRGALGWAAAARGLTPEGGRLQGLELELERALVALVPGAMAALRASALGAVSAADDEEALGGLCERLGANTLVSAVGTLRVSSSPQRKRRGSFFTPRSITREVVELALAPLARSLSELETDARAAQIGSFRACDPAMGAGAFLLETGRQLVTLLAPAPGELARARRLVAGCLHGVDVSPLAVAVAEASLWLWVADAEYSLDAAGRQLAVADSLAGEAEGGPVYDLVIGNPPWVAYAGRSAQPIPREQRRRMAARFSAWRGFPTLHSLFVQRASELAPQGVIALLVPSPLSDLDGYRAVRKALTRRHRVREPLLELGQDAFEGVVQSCIALIADPTGEPTPSERVWVLRERQRLHANPEPVAVPAALRALAEAAPLPPSTFRELGFQTTGDVTRRLLRRASAPDAEFTLPLLEGKDVREFFQGPPRLFLRADLEQLRCAKARLRPPEDYAAVGFVVRQTASFPIAARHGGLPFRNSLLAGFASEALGVDLLVALLNSALYRALHLAAQRDARQAVFPQVKIGHLRRLPLPPPDANARAEVADIGAQASREGFDRALRARLDDAVFRLFAVPADHAAEIGAFLARRAPSLGYGAAPDATTPLDALLTRIEEARACFTRAGAGSGEDR